MGFFRALVKITAMPLWLLFIIFAGYIYVKIYKQQPNRLLHIYWKVWGWIIGLKVKYPKNFKVANRTVFTSNHISYLDILVSGIALNPVFIGKKEIRSWPVFGFGADKIAGIFYIDRRRSQIINEKKRLVSFVENVQRNLWFFPEGTTSEGKDLLPFKAAIFDTLLSAKGAKVQPMAIRYTHINGKKITTKSDRRKVAWYNDADPKKYPSPPLLSHLWQLLKNKSITVKIIPSAKPIIVSDFSDRRSLTKKVQEEVRKCFEKK